MWREDTKQSKEGRSDGVGRGENKAGENKACQKMMENTGLSACTALAGVTWKTKHVPKSL